jgi:transposase
MVLEHGGEYPSEWAALGSISAKLGMTRETLRRWVRRAELERENRELRRANEILRAASLFFARELDPRPPKR